MSERMKDNRTSLDWQLRNGTGLDAALCLKAANRITELEQEVELLKEELADALGVDHVDYVSASYFPDPMGVERQNAEAREKGDE